MGAADLGDRVVAVADEDPLVELRRPRPLLVVEGAAGARGVGRELLEVEPAHGPGIARIAGKKRPFDGLRQVDQSEHRPLEIGEVGSEDRSLLGGEFLDRIAHRAHRSGAGRRGGVSRISSGYRLSNYPVLTTSKYSISSSAGRRPIGTGFLLAGLLAIAAGLLLPLVLGSFSRRQAWVLAVVEAGCLAVVAVGVALLARRLRSSHEALWALARRDELTGVGNYRGLHERLGEEIARHRRHSREFAVILLDLDGFKAINERFGHLEGDRLLVEIGAALSDELRAEDSVFRQGGDEFAVIVPEAQGEEAEEVVARLRRRVSRRGFGSDEARPVSAATGFAMFPADGSNVEDLLGFADLDLFAAKRGRVG